MKKELFLLIFPLLLAGMSAHGQDSLSFLSQKRFGITLQLNSPNPDEVNVGWFNIDTESLDDHNLLHKSFSMGAALHYRLDKETTLRLRFARGTTHVEEYQEEVYDPRLDEYRREFMVGRQVKLQIAPSIIWELGSGRLRFFAGFELPVNLHGDYEFKSAATVLDGNRQFKYEAEVGDRAAQGIFFGHRGRERFQLLLNVRSFYRGRVFPLAALRQAIRQDKKQGRCANAAR